MQCAIRIVLIKLCVDNLFSPHKPLGTPLTDVTIGMYLNRISAVDENKEVSLACSATREGFVGFMACLVSRAKVVDSISGNLF